MRIKRKIFAVVFLFLLLFLCVNFAEAKASADSKSRNIFELFSNSNPKLKAATVKNYVELIIKACDKYKQDPYVIAAIIVHESTVNNKAVGGNNYGLMQINWKAHSAAVKKEYPKVKHAKDLFDARTNIFYGTKIFADCVSRAGSVKGGLLKYTGGNEKHTNRVLATVKQLQSKDTKNVKKKKK